jgi:hypothetical protein
MSLPMPYAGIDATEAGRPNAHTFDDADIPVWQYNNMLLIDQLRKSWSSIALGIILAGGLYPVLAGVALLTIQTLIDWPGLFDFIQLSFALLLLAFVGAVAGMVWTNVWVVGTLPIVLIVVWSLKIRGSIVWIGAFWGGLVGCIAVLPFLLMAGFNDHLLLGIVIGPALTTVIGQIGGAWGGQRAVRRIAWYESIARRRTDECASEPHHQSSPKADETEAAGSSIRFQFRIRHLLWTFVWMSVLLSVVRLLGVPFEIVMPFLFGWLVYQAATLWIGGRLVRLVAG